MRLLYLDSEIYLWGMCHDLGTVGRSLDELKRDGLICNEVKDLAAQGYQQNFSIAPDESLQSLAAATFGRLLHQGQTPGAVVFHSSFAENTSLPVDPAEPGFMPRLQYLPAAVMRQFKMDHVPYFISFGSGCTGLVSMLMMAAGLCPKTPGQPVLCLTVDVKPPGTTFDAWREKILTTDSSSGFWVGREKRGYRLLGISYYSTTRQIVPLVQIVKLAVQMIRELAAEAGIDLATREIILHYPNAFASAWDMVTNYLKVPKKNQVLEGLPERAHCQSSDSVISLGRHHGGGEGRVHIVLNFGTGIHLGVCILSEVQSLRITND